MSVHVVPLEPRVIRALPAFAGTVAIAAASTLPVFCPFRMWSGHACPLCGMTRAVGSLVTGDAGTAVRYHPLVVLIALEVAVLGLFFAWHGKRPPAPAVFWIVGINLAAFTAVWLIRWRLGLLSFVLS